jgi:hypothetical protein
LVLNRHKSDLCFRSNPIFQALTLIFQLGDQPDSLAGDVIKAVCRRVQEQQVWGHKYDLY